ncbi:MAG: hypothetical protein MO853_05275 [Candidatus Protistobacter heckmanni]|nr:hypothetical protein [Candidatus Protistobacter heckmanni]
MNVAEMGLTPAHSITILAGHPGRSHLMLNWLDASMTDECAPLSDDPALDIYDPRNQPFTPSFVALIRQKQLERSERITAWVRQRLAHLRGLPDPIHDEAMLVYRTYADPRFVDLSLDANDRAPGGNRGGKNPRSVNYGVNSLCRYTSLTGWISQWSLASHADGPSNLAKTTVPVLHMEYTVGASIFPSKIRRWSQAMGARETFHRVRPGTHYLLNQPALIEDVADAILGWLSKVESEPSARAA